jgi:hypothetical protein
MFRPRGKAVGDPLGAAGTRDRLTGAFLVEAKSMNGELKIADRRVEIANLHFSICHFQFPRTG